VTGDVVHSPAARATAPGTPTAGGVQLLGRLRPRGDEEDPSRARTRARTRWQRRPVHEGFWSTTSPVGGPGARSLTTKETRSSGTSRCTAERAVRGTETENRRGGVTPASRYDALGRLTVSESAERKERSASVVFDPWKQTTFKSERQRGSAGSERLSPEKESPGIRRGRRSVTRHAI
jgi:hypothetical protein